MRQNVLTAQAYSSLMTDLNWSLGDKRNSLVMPQLSLIAMSNFKAIQDENCQLGSKKRREWYIRLEAGAKWYLIKKRAGLDYLHAYVIITSTYRVYVSVENDLLEASAAPEKVKIKGKFIIDYLIVINANKVAQNIMLDAQEMLKT